MTCMMVNAIMTEVQAKKRDPMERQEARDWGRATFTLL